MHSEDHIRHPGWRVVAASAIGLSTGPGQFVFGSLGLFILPFAAEFGWDRAEIGFALTWFTLALAAATPVIGIAIDAQGVRRVLLPSIGIVASGLAALPLAMHELWHIYLIFALLGALGAGANSLPYLRAIATWFDRRRGLAIGLAMCGGGLGYAYVPPFVQYLIDGYGWRAGYLGLAALTLVVALPLAFAFVHENPAAIVDQGVPGATGDSRQGSTVIRGIVSTRSFWNLLLVFSASAFSLYGLLPHLVPMLVDRGYEPAEAALAFSTLGVTIVVARVVVGYFLDRLFAPRVAALCFLLSAAGFALLAFGDGAPSMFAAACLLGLSIGAEIDLLAFLSSRYFGLRRFGTAYGILFAAFMVGASLGPLSYGLAYERSGSYLGILNGAVGLLVIAGLLAWFLPRYPAQFPAKPIDELQDG